MTPEDDYDALKEFNHVYEGARTAIEEMHLEYQDLLQADPELEWRLQLLPGAVFSGRKRSPQGMLGVFLLLCSTSSRRGKPVTLPKMQGLRAGTSTNFDRAEVLEEPGDIAESIRSKPETPRKCFAEEKTLIKVRSIVEKYIKNTYLKRVDAPVGVKPSLKCWMELDE